MQPAVSDYLLEWQDAKGAVAISFLKDSLQYVDHCPIDKDLIETSLEQLERVYTNVTFQHKNQPIISNNAVAIEWEMRCQSEDKDSPLPSTMTFGGSDFIRLSDDRIQSIDLYFDPSPFISIQKQLATTATRYKRTGISFDISQQISHHIDQLMQSERLYLQSDLTLSRLAAIANVHPNHVSQAINQQFKVSFNHWLSGYRIRYAESLLTDPGQQQLSVLDIAFAVGFNSKSVFYTAFKQRFGVTPNQYRQQAVVLSPIG